MDKEAKLALGAKREHLLAMPDFGRVRRTPKWPNPFLDFTPDLKGSQRFLWSFMGQGFGNEAEAELVRSRINARAIEVGLKEAVNQFRSMRSRQDLLTVVIESFLEDAPTMGSIRSSGEPYSSRTLDHYRATLRRAQPYFENMTMREFFKLPELIQFKSWFRKETRPEGAPLEPGKYGRGSRPTTRW